MVTIRLATKWYKQSRGFADRQVDHRDSACCKETALVFGKAFRIKYCKVGAVRALDDLSSVDPEHLIVEAAANEKKTAIYTPFFHHSRYWRLDIDFG
ncbi:UNVERIFIED_ORG: hypothetical protein GGD43_006055 [Rhizobium esperanzae]|jgi:hypothetical protein